MIITTDYSDTAGNAAAYAASLAPLLGIRQILLYHAYGQVPVSTEIPIQAAADKREHEEHLVALRHFEDQHLRPYLNDDIQIIPLTDEHFLPFGVEALCKKYDPVLVVAGTTGKSAMEKLIMGSNTVHLATLCPAPLLIVGKEVRFRPLKKLLFTCDFLKVTSTAPVEAIRMFTERLKADLLVLNISLPGKGIKAESIGGQFALHKLLDALHPEYHYEEAPNVVEGILQHARQEAADLIITVPKSQGFLESIFHKSVTKRLALNRALELPLLVLREKD